MLKQAVDVLVSALAEGDCHAGEAAIGEVLAALDAGYDDVEVRRALDELRSSRCFALMSMLARRAVPHAKGRIRST